MLLAIAIVIVQQLTFLSYLTESALFTRAVSEETHALMIGVALFSTILSIPSLFWNVIMVKESDEKKDIIGVIISIATFIFGVGFLLFAFLSKLHANGGRLF